MNSVNQKIVCVTMDLEPDHAGFLDKNKYSLWNKKNINRLTKFFHKNNIPLTIFVVGESINKNKQTIRCLSNLKSEFNLHSNSHSFSKPDTKGEILDGIRNFSKYFGYKPAGYRAPKGLVTRRGLDILSNQNFSYDSSIIPSFWPHPKYLKYHSYPFYHNLSDNKKLLEIPISVTPTFRLPFSLSFVKLFGLIPYRKYISNTSPKIIVFNFHLHDIYTSNYFEKLPFPAKMLYKINHDSGFSLLSKLISILKESKYKFILMSQLVKMYEK